MFWLRQLCDRRNAEVKGHRLDETILSTSNKSENRVIRHLTTEIDPEDTQSPKSTTGTFSVRLKCKPCVRRESNELCYKDDEQ